MIIHVLSVQQLREHSLYRQKNLIQMEHEAGYKNLIYQTEKLKNEPAAVYYRLHWMWLSLSQKCSSI